MLPPWRPRGFEAPIPSIGTSVPKLFNALPSIIKPPQSPLNLAPGALLEVNTIGLHSVPFAIIFAPLWITNALITVFASPRTTVPASIVSVTKLSTNTVPCSK